MPKLDILKSLDITAAAEAVAKQTGGILNVLISNAGRNHFMPILDEDLDSVRNLFEVNLIAPIALTQAFAPLLIKAKGMAVFIASISGYLNISYMGTYAALKKSVEIVADTLRLELAPFGVGVLKILTGGVKSMGQTYFDDLKLPEKSLYKSIENVIVNRAQGGDGMPRMDTTDYATAVGDEIIKRTTGRFWCGQNADRVRMSTTAAEVPQSAMDAGAVMGTGLDTLGR
ncbi:putative hydroxybutyrate dehydrogenase [Xylariaceae sp. FL0662B]|nr:putative hydroxybutyrate dehydrogenase [Xylariaceae sp. FL0662B]